MSWELLTKILERMQGHLKIPNKKKCQCCFMNFIKFFNCGLDFL